MKNKEINLILQGGGVKGLAYIGALRCLEENGYKVKNVAGSSIGAVIGSLIIAGYDSFELEELINKMNGNMFLKENTLDQKIKNKGLYSISHMEKYLEKLLLDKNIKVFGDIKVGNYYKAIFITTSIKHKRIFVLPYDLKLINVNPDTFPIAKAVIMSASIPFFYEPYKVNNHLFFDGGMSDNYPTWCFKKGIALKVGKDNTFFDNIKQSIFGKINNVNNIYEIFINTNNYKAIDFKKGFNNKYDLYNRGYYAVKNYLKNNNLNL